MVLVTIDKGYWNQIESYVSDRSEAEFSHSICPDCIKKLYPEFSILFLRLRRSEIYRKFILTGTVRKRYY
jgi:hypothetical protein